MKKIIGILLVAGIAFSVVGCGGGGGGGGGGSAPATLTQPGPGPGDQANYFPVAVGNTWEYRGVQTENGQGQVGYHRTATVTGTKMVNGFNATVVKVESSLDAGSTYDEYLYKAGNGIFNCGNNDTTDTMTPQIAPYPELLFPVQTGAGFTQYSKSGLDIGDDLDGDGISDNVTITATVNVAGFETVTLQIGSFPAALRLVQTVNYTYKLSSNGQSVPATETDVINLVSGVGIIKQSQTISIPDANYTINATEELSGYFVDGQGKGIVAEETLAAGIAPANSDTETPGRPAVAFDGTNFLVVSQRVVGATSTMTGSIVSSTGMAVKGFDIAVPGNNRCAVAYGANSYLVVFAPSTSQISAYRITPEGVVIDGPAGITISSMNPNSYNYFPAVASDGTNFLIVWSQFNLNSNLNYIQAALVTPEGQVLKEFKLVNSPGEQGVPTVAFDGTNYLVAWQDTRNSSDADIYGTRVKSDGTVLDPAGIPITTAPGLQWAPQITYSGGKYMVVWVDGGYMQAMTVHGARISTDGVLLDGPASAGGLSINTTDIVGGYPAVAPLGNDFLVVWDVQGYDPSRGIYGARINSSGELVSLATGGAIFPITGSPTEFATRFIYPVVSKGVSNSLVVWINNREVMGSYKDLQSAVLYPF